MYKGVEPEVIPAHYILGKTTEVAKQTAIEWAINECEENYGITLNPTITIGDTYGVLRGVRYGSYGQLVVTACDILKFGKKVEYDISLTNCQNMFSLFTATLEEENEEITYSVALGTASLTELDVTTLDTSHVTNMENMFYCCVNLTSLDLSNFDTSNVTSMHSMFGNCIKLQRLNLSAFDTRQVKTYNDGYYYQGMFYNCPPTLEITTNRAFQQWCITNAETIELPPSLHSASSSQWHIID